jgi:hypothetical protein
MDEQLWRVVRFCFLGSYFFKCFNSVISPNYLISDISLYCCLLVYRKEYRFIHGIRLNIVRV